MLHFQDLEYKGNGKIAPLNQFEKKTHAHTHTQQKEDHLMVQVYNYITKVKLFTFDYWVVV